MRALVSGHWYQVLKPGPPLSVSVQVREEVVILEALRPWWSGVFSASVRVELPSNQRSQPLRVSSYSSDTGRRFLGWIVVTLAPVIVVSLRRSLSVVLVSPRPRNSLK
jgi:hypothetical protein